MIIQNFSHLATSALRKQALQIAEAGLLAINTKNAVMRSFKFDPNTQKLKVQDKEFNLKQFERVVVVGFGKAALEAVTQVQETLAGHVTCGYVIDLKEGSLGNIVCKIGTHPLPTKINIEATNELVEMLKACTEKDLVICVISGGGSALLCRPHDMNCEKEVSIISALTVKAASITEINTVRKHISSVKGGHLAQIIYPATCISLIFSDVPGDDISVVASGPTVKDTTTNADAAKILAKYQVLEMCEMPSCRLLETPKDEKYFEKVSNFLVVSGKTALKAMREKAEELGYSVKIFAENFEGEARVLAEDIIKSSHKHTCLLGAGESTVKIVGKGAGGRNQEMALAALPLIKENQVFITVASDGHDNTEAAGAIADLNTRTRSGILNLKSEIYLNNNDSFTFFEKLGDQLITGNTGANVSDFFVMLEQ